MNAVQNGKLLRQLRGSQAVSETAKALNISESSLTKYEYGVRTPRDDLKVRMAEFYNKSVQELFYSN